MNKLLISAVASVLLSVGIFSFLFRGQIVSKPEIAQPPHIEVLAQGVFEVDATGKTLRTLVSGDELAVGMRVKTDKTGSAEIYFADDSTARLDAGSEIVIDEASYTGKKGISARFTLVVGRVWSKVIALTTPQSVWEVKTANTVATVRGTAFSIEFQNGASRVIGSEHTVEVAPIDKKTGKVLESQSVLVSEDMYVELDDVAVAAAASASVSAPDKTGEAPKKALQSRKVTTELLKDKWLDKNKDEDTTLRTRSEARKKKQEERKREVKRQEEEDSLSKPTEALINSGETKAPVTTSTVEVPRTTSGGTASVSDEVSSLEISADRGFGELTEGEAVHFRAFLKFKSGNKKEVTSTVLWKVLGSMGAIDKNGVFAAKLADEIAEAGEFSGAIVATFQDSATGKEFLGKTNIFNVRAKIVQDLLDIGGQ